MPTVGHSAFVWGRVHNKGSAAVSNAVVKYYWANPSMVITPSTATLIGTSYVSLDAGETKNVLCLTPWIPTWVNNGHECLIVEAFSQTDPVLHGSLDPFNPREDRHVAQKNLGILSVRSGMSMMAYPFAAGGMRSGEHEITVLARQVPIRTIEPLQNSLGFKKLPPDATNKIKGYGLQKYICGEQIKSVGEQKITFKAKSGQQQAMALAIQISSEFGDEGALFLVEELLDDRVIGGIGVLLLPDKQDKLQERM